MLATEKPRHPTPAESAVAMGNRATLEAQTKNPASDQGQVNIGAARQMAGDVGRAPMPLPSAPAGSATETLGGYTPTGQAGVYRRGNAFSDLAGLSGAAFLNRGPATPQNQSATEALAERYQGQTAAALRQQASAPQTMAPPPRFDANRAAAALTDLRSPEYIALRNAQVSGMPRSAYAALFKELTEGPRTMMTEQMKDEGATERAQLQEAGATGRTAMTEGGNMARALMTNGVQQGELALKQETQGIANSAAQQLAQVQQNYLNAKTPQERAQAAQSLRVLTGKDEQPTAPSGYRWAGGGNLQAITGGPADRSRDPKLTEDQGKAAGYAVRMENSLNLLGEINKTNPGATRPGVGTALLNTLPEGVANLARTEDRQRVEAAQLDALDAALTLNTGAAYTREQLQGMSRSYFAQPGDSDKTVAEKQGRLASLIETARLRAGPQGNQMADAALARGRQDAQQPVGQPQPVPVPQAGEVRKGYVFKGGNPADKANWEPAR